MMKNIRAERKDERDAKKQKSEDVKALYQMVFSTPEARKVLAHLDAVCGYNEDSFVENPHTSAYRQGRQSIAIHIHKIINS